MQTPNEMRQELESALSNIDINQEHMKMLTDKQSKMFYERYKSLIDSGFSKEQAFELVKDRGLS
jgi:hypothetical protein